MQLTQEEVVINDEKIKEAISKKLKLGNYVPGIR